MPELVNPLAAFRDAYGTLEGMAQDRTRRVAGNALAGGDYQGAQSALYGRGMLQEGQAVGTMQQGAQDREAGQQQAQAEAAKKRLAETFTLLGNVNEAMSRIPPEQRAEYFRTQVVPQLQNLPGVTPEAIAQMTAPTYDWTDQGIATHRALLGQEAEKLQLFNTSGGIVGVNGQGQANMVYQAPPKPPEQIEGPDGIYERGADGQWKKVANFGPAPRAPGAARPASSGMPAPQPARSYGSGADPQW